MHSRQKILLVTTTILLLFGFSVFIGPATTPGPALGVQGPVYGGEVFVGTSDDPDSLNPLLAQTLYAFYVIGPLFDALVDLDSDNNPIPVLAKEIPEAVITDEAWTVTFEIRDGAQWHDGTPVTAYDFEWTIGQLTDPEIGPTVQNYIDIVEYDTDWTTQDLVVTALDDTHVKMETRLWNADLGKWEPYEFAPFFLNGPAGIPALPKHILADSADWKTDPWNQAPIGDGAFMFDSGEPGNFWRLVRNPNYYRTDEMGNQLPYLDAVTFKYYDSDEAMMAAFLNQEIDFHGFQLQKSDREELMETADELGLDIQLVQRPDDGFRFIQYNTESVCVPRAGATTTTCQDTGMNPLSDKRVRQALSLAVDKEDILSRHYDGEGMATPTIMIPFNAWAYNDDPALREYIRYDPEAAEALLDAAGYPRSFVMPDPFGGDDLRLRFDGWDLRVLVGSHDVRRYQTAITITQYFEAIGIKSHVVTTSFNLILLDVYDAGAFELYVGGYGNMGIDADWLYGLLGSQAAFRTTNNDWSDDGDNIGNWINATFDDLGFQARSTTDISVRASLYKQMQAIAAQEQPSYNYFVADAWHAYYSTFMVPMPGTGLGGPWMGESLLHMYFAGGPMTTSTPMTTTTPKPTTTTTTPAVPELANMVVTVLLILVIPVVTLLYRRKK